MLLVVLPGSYNLDNRKGNSQWVVWGLILSALRCMISVMEELSTPMADQIALFPQFLRLVLDESLFLSMSFRLFIFVLVI